MEPKNTALKPGDREKIDAVQFALGELRAALGGYPATPGWLMTVADRAWLLEEVTHETHFGGADVLIWWLAEQVRKSRRAWEERNQRIRSARGMELQFLAVMEQVAPHSIGFRIWDHLTVSSYLGQLCAERIGMERMAELRPPKEEVQP